MKTQLMLLFTDMTADVCVCVCVWRRVHQYGAVSLPFVNPLLSQTGGRLGN